MLKLKVITEMKNSGLQSTLEMTENTRCKLYKKGKSIYTHTQTHTHLYI